MYQNQGFVATTATANFTQQQQQDYYNYYYPQQQQPQQQQQGVYYPNQPPLPPNEPSESEIPPPPQPPGGGGGGAEVNSNEPPPPGTGTAANATTATSSEVEPTATQGGENLTNSQQKEGSQPQTVTEPSLDVVPSEQSVVTAPNNSTPYNNTSYAYPQPTPTGTTAGTGAATTADTSWNGGAQPLTTCSSQWYPPQGGGVVSWGGTHNQQQPQQPHTDWSNYHGNWQQSGWPPQQSQQQQGSAQWGGSGEWNQQWAGQGGGATATGQWAGQGGVATATGQWGQWQGQPGVEAWSGQAYGVYQQQQQQDYSYPNYGNTHQQSQQQSTPPLPKPLTKNPRPPSPGTPPLPDLPSPGGGGGGSGGNQQEAAVVHPGVHQGGQGTGGGSGSGSGGHLGRKHQRTSDHGGSNGSGKRTKKGSGDGQGLPHNDGGGNNSGNTARQRSRSRWNDPKEPEDPINYNAVPPPNVPLPSNLPLPTPKIPPRNFSYHHQRHQPPPGQLRQHPGGGQPHPPPEQPHHPPSLHNSSNPYPLPVGLHQTPILNAGNPEHHNSTQQHQEEPQNDSSVPNNHSKDKMPLKMKEYVSRAFSSAITEEERELVHHHLDSELNKIFAKKLQWGIDWDAYPMPLDDIKKKPSRWDTPSPNADFMNLSTKKPPLFPSPSPSHQIGGEFKGNYYDDDDDDNEGWGRGRGGKKKKRRFNRGKRGKNNRFFIDHQPIPGMSLEPVVVVTQEDKAKINLRINRFGKQEGNKNARKKISIDDLVKSVTSTNVDEQIYWQDSSVEGTSQALEKRYLRLTSAPDPSKVRPLRVLKLSLNHVCEKWKANPDDYHYACEQFKSIRQDLTIQGIRDAFTVEVYETHARVAIQNNDREEFNQCQTQLMALYEEEPGVYSNEAEFIAYRILYLIFTRNTEAMSTILLELTPDLRRAPCIKHIQTLCSAWFSSNFSKFFRFYRTAPLLCGALINIFIERERKVALKTMARAYRPNLPVSYLSDVLGFPDKDHCLAFLVDMDAVLINNDSSIDCKLTQAKLSTPSTAAT